LTKSFLLFLAQEMRLKKFSLKNEYRRATSDGLARERFGLRARAPAPTKVTITLATSTTGSFSIFSGSSLPRAVESPHEFTAVAFFLSLLTTHAGVMAANSLQAADAAGGARPGLATHSLRLALYLLYRALRFRSFFLPIYLFLSTIENLK
jgi:hypothetical protein